MNRNTCMRVASSPTKFKKYICQKAKFIHAHENAAVESSKKI